MNTDGHAPILARWGCPHTWQITCPNCGRRHTHGLGEGWRSAHCRGGGGEPYYILPPDDPAPAGGCSHLAPLPLEPRPRVFRRVLLGPEVRRQREKAEGGQ